MRSAHLAAGRVDGSRRRLCGRRRGWRRPEPLVVSRGRQRRSVEDEAEEELQAGRPTGRSCEGRQAERPGDEGREASGTGAETAGRRRGRRAWRRGNPSYAPIVCIQVQAVWGKRKRGFPHFADAGQSEAVCHVPLVFLRWQFSVNMSSIRGSSI